jgi:hypothetical protein
MTSASSRRWSESAVSRRKGFISSSDTLVNVQGPSGWIQYPWGSRLLGTTTQAFPGYTFLGHDRDPLPERSLAVLLARAQLALAWRTRCAQEGTSRARRIAKLGP